jgi:hypothetical protein
MCVRRQIHHQARSNFANTIYGAKRLIGRKHDEPEVLQEMKLLPFRVVKVCVCVCVCVFVCGVVLSLTCVGSVTSRWCAG